MLIEVFVGMLLALGLLGLGHKIYPNKAARLWQQGLLIAALIYVVFALFGENPKWILIECGGVLLYGLFVFLAIRKSILFLSLGWGLQGVIQIYAYQAALLNLFKIILSILLPFPLRYNALILSTTCRPLFHRCPDNLHRC